MATPSNTLQPIIERGWRRGFSNLFRSENGLRWGKNRWIISVLIWLVILNGFVFLVAFSEAESGVSTPAEIAAESSHRLYDHRHNSNRRRRGYRSARRDHRREAVRDGGLGAFQTCLSQRLCAGEDAVALSRLPYSIPHLAQPGFPGSELAAVGNDS